MGKNIVNENRECLSRKVKKSLFKSVPNVILTMKVAKTFKDPTFLDSGDVSPAKLMATPTLTPTEILESSGIRNLSTLTSKIPKNDSRNQDGFRRPEKEGRPQKSHCLP